MANSGRRPAARVVVVGGAGGIGSAIIERFRCDSSYELISVGRRAGTVDHAVEVSDAGAVSACFTLIGEVDILVYAVGTGGSGQPFWVTDVSHISASVASNILGFLYCTHAVLPGMVTRGSGHIIHIGSVAALYPIASSCYAATKGASHAFTTSLRVELRGSGVRVTEVSPGRVNTGFSPNTDGIQPPKAAVLQPADVAEAVWFAATSSAAVQVSHIELTPTIQVLGGSTFMSNRDKHDKEHR